MLDGISLDQLRTFIAAAEEGSFSAAGRRLARAQSVVSQTIANLEGQIGVVLFDRSGRYPVLTEQGRVLLADARLISCGLDTFKARARGMSEGVEPELSAVFDTLFPMSVLTAAAAAFGEAFPLTPLRLYAESLGGVAQSVLDGRCSLGVIGPLGVDTPRLTRERLLGVRMVMTAAPSHPLASLGRPATNLDLSRHVQLVLTDRSELTKGLEFGVRSPRSWRLSDLSAKHAFLRAGLGWGGMPYDAVRRDLAEGALIELALEDQPPEGFVLPMSLAYISGQPPGPAGRWLIDKIRAIGSPDGLNCPNAKLEKPLPQPAEREIVLIGA